MSNNDKKKKKTEPVIVAKGKPIPGSRPVQTSHFEPLWYKPVPVVDPSTSSYYPAGQRIIEGQGREYTSGNFINYFGEQIRHNDLEVIKSADKTRIEVNKLSKERKYAICHTVHHVFLALLTACVIALVLSIPSYILIQNGVEHISIDLIMIFIPYALIILLVSFISTLILKEFELKLKLTLEGGRLKSNEI